jgi:hypothetical protein
MTAEKWKARLAVEAAHLPRLEALSREQWGTLLWKRKLLSENYDTVVSLDWPHYCYGATEGCGGQQGWCYTMQGRHASSAHHRRVALTDGAARLVPDLFSARVYEELQALCRRGALADMNLRYSGSGELVLGHVPALMLIAQRGVRLWGFTRNLAVAERLKGNRISVIFSCDRTTRRGILERASRLGLPLGYTSTDVADLPPSGTFVTFPLHRSGHVREVVKCETLCPKVVEEYLEGSRRSGLCQGCRRCFDASL